MPNNQGYDVFISYAHVDNEAPPNVNKRMGWVTALKENLNIGPNVRKKEIFIDHQLKPGDAFSDDLIAKVENSKLLVLLLSQHYINSEWCCKELEHFIQAHSNDAEKPSDVFVVELSPYEKLVDVPENILKLRKHLIHAKFWFQPTDASALILSGYPTPQESGEEASKHYWQTLNELRTAIDTRLCQHKSVPDLTNSTEASENKDAHPEEKIAKAPSATILLADVTDDLESNRNEVKLALQAEGIQVLPDGDYIGLSPQEFDTAFAEDLKKSECFVQLLSPVVGRKGKGFVAPLPQLQFQRALAANKPMMQWCEKLPAPNQITDPTHAKLFGTEFIRTTNLINFKTEIIDRLRTEREKREKAAAASMVQPKPKTGRKVVFIDDFASQPELQQKLRALIKQQNCDLRFVPAGAPLGNNGIDIKEVLRPCLAGMTIYTDKTKYLAAYYRLMFFLNQMAEAEAEAKVKAKADLPLLRRWGVYLLEGDIASVFGIDSENVVPVNEQNLEGFLQGLSR